LTEQDDRVPCNKCGVGEGGGVLALCGPCRCHFLWATLSHGTWLTHRAALTNLWLRLLRVLSGEFSLHSHCKYDCNIVCLCTMYMLNTDPTGSALNETEVS